MSAPQPLARLVDCLSTHADRDIVFYANGDDTTVTFANLHAQVLHAAETARAWGISQASVVALIACNGCDALVIDFALLAIGCTTIHVPEGSAASFLKSVEAPLTHLIAAPEYASAADARSYSRLGTIKRLRVYERDPALVEPEERLNGVPAVVFSSGTSGKVKRLLVSAAGVQHCASVFFSSFEPRSKDTFLIFLPLSNYQQKLLIYGCVSFGINICLTDSANVVSALRSTRPTLFLAPPIFYESAWKIARLNAQADPSHVTSANPAKRSSVADYFGGLMRLMWSGMAPIAPELLHGFRDAGVPLYEAYGMTEYGPIAANLVASHRDGSVGRPLAPGSVRILADGEITVRSEHPLTVGYWGESAATERETFLDTHTIATGDLGHMDADGYLVIDGRKKELLVTSAGHKIHPQQVEREFARLPFVSHAVLMGSGRPHLGLLVVVASVEASMFDAINQRIHALNADLCKACPIRNWSLVAGELSAENGFLTRNLKLNRSAVASAYEELVFSPSGSTNESRRSKPIDGASARDAE